MRGLCMDGLTNAPVVRREPGGKSIAHVSVGYTLVGSDEHRSGQSRNANTTSFVSSFDCEPCPPAAMATICLPRTLVYMRGVAFALVGSAPFQSSLPVRVSNARMKGSTEAPINTRPLSVVAGPPRLGPSGTRHAISPLSTLTATSSPQGGAMHGLPEGERKNSRDIANGAPSCSV